MQLVCPPRLLAAQVGAPPHRTPFVTTYFTHVPTTTLLLIVLFFMRNKLSSKSTKTSWLWTPSPPRSLPQLGRAQPRPNPAPSLNSA